MALSEASDPKNEGSIGQLIYERCEKLPPLVKPVDQHWHCKFGFKNAKIAQNCSVVMSVQADDHFGVWRPLMHFNPQKSEWVSTLACNDKHIGKNVH